MPFCWARLPAKRFIAGVGGNVPGTLPTAAPSKGSGRADAAGRARSNEGDIDRDIDATITLVNLVFCRHRCVPHRTCGRPNLRACHRQAAPAKSNPLPWSSDRTEQRLLRLGRIREIRMHD